MFRIAFIIFFICINTLSFAQTFKGRVLDINMKPLIDVNIYQADSPNGTMSNKNGEFSLLLIKGDNQIFVQSVGYQTQIVNIDKKTINKEITLVLEEEIIVLPEFKMLATNEDPAYFIMRKAIAMAPYYKAQISQYDCKAYLKGSFMITHIPWAIKKLMGDDAKDLKVGKSYVSESLSEIHYEYPNKISQNIIAIRSSEADKEISPLPMAISSLYDSDSYKVASPLSLKAFSVYKFKLMGSFMENGECVNKIKVIPRAGRTKGVFSGFIYVYDKRWNLHSVDLNMNLSLLVLNMKQIFSNVEEGVWMCKSSVFKASGGLFGVTGNGDYTVSISNYSVVKNPNLDHSILARLNGDVNELNNLLDKKSLEKEQSFAMIKTKRQKKIDELLDKDNLTNSDTRKLNKLIKQETKREKAIEPLEIRPLQTVEKNKIRNDSLFWARRRPIKLTKDEDVSFVSKDSLQKIINKPKYIDSVRNEQRAFKFSHILFGNKYFYSDETSNVSSSFDTPALFGLTNVSFNTVEGFNMSFPFAFSRRDKRGADLYATLSPNIALARKALTFDASLAYMYNTRTLSFVKLEAGNRLVDFKGLESGNKLENMAYSLFAEKNYMKLYENRQASFIYSTEIINGLIISSKLSYQRRLPLINNTSFTFIDYKSREYSDNIIDNNNVLSWQYADSEAVNVSCLLEYTYRQYFMYKDNMKVYLKTYYPTFSLLYKRALGSFVGDASYDFLRLGAKQNIQIRSNSLEYDIQAAKYLSSNKMYAQDIQYFRALSEPVSLSNDIRRFRTMNYYQALSKDYFVEAHLRYTMDRFLIKRLPFFNDRLFMREALFLSYIKTETNNHYLELGYSINNIFALLDAELVAGFNKNKMDYLGLRFNIKLK